MFCAATIGDQPKPAISAECSALSHFALATVVSQLHSRTCTLTIAVSQLQSHNCIHIWILTAALMHSQPSLVLLCPDVQMTNSRRVFLFSSPLFRNQAFVYHMSDCEFGGMRDSGPSTHSDPNEGSMFDARIHFVIRFKAKLIYDRATGFCSWPMRHPSLSLLHPLPQISMTQ